MSPPTVQDPSDLEKIINTWRPMQRETFQIYLWEPARYWPRDKRWARGAWRVADGKKTRPDAHFWGPRNTIYPSTRGLRRHIEETSTLVLVEPDGIWQSRPPRFGYDDSHQQKLPRDPIVVLAEQEERDNETLCEPCAKIPFRQLLLSGQSYRVSCLVADGCRLCRTISEHISDGSDSIGQEVTLSVKQDDGMQSPRLVIKTGPQQAQQASLAMLYSPGGTEYFSLLQKWLQDSEDEIRPRSLPTRLIHMAHSENGFKLRLVETENSKSIEPYIALSHCWGGIDTFCTTSENYEERLEDIDHSKLPKTFQHAVIAAWNLGVEYLWIDSLCIKQRDTYDWRRESTKMESVFAYAYCTLAATSARNCNQGFLGRSAESFVRLGDSEVDLPLFVCTRGTDHDFDRDVDQGLLNKRAWVFQERVLSRRTIHFTAQQTYFECGSKILCETMGSESQSTGTLQRLQSQLSKRMGFSDKQGSLFEECFSQYSTLDITDPTDRPSAILGLESRLAESYETASLYGIIMSSFYKSLFWHRAGNERMKAIDFPEENVPSWSWMAYEGAIGYGFIPGSFSDLIHFGYPKKGGEEEIKLTNAGRLAPVRESAFLLIAPLHQVRGGCAVEPDKGSNCRIRDGDKLLGWIRYDGVDKEGEEALLCIRVGRFATRKKDSRELLRSEFVPVLIVMPTYREGERVEKTYQRLGVGIVRQDCLVPDEQGLVWVT